MTMPDTNKMQDGWEEKTWGDLATLEYGKGLLGYKNAIGHVPVFGTNGQIGWHDEPLCNDSGIIVGRKGAYRGIHFSTLPFYVIDTAFYLRPTTPIDIKWAYWKLLTYDINSMDSGSAIPSTSRDAFYSLPVDVPPLPEQKAIADVLSSLDDKIELLRKQNETLEAIAQAIFKERFVNFNFPDKNGKPYKDSGGKMIDSELGPIPDGWRVESLSKIADFLNGLALQKYPPESETQFLPVIKIRELKSGITAQTDKASTEINSKYIVNNGDVLFSWSGSLELVVWKYGDGALNQHLFKVTSDEYAKWFYYYWVKQHLLDFRQIAANKATTMGHIQRHHLDEAKVVIPNDAMMTFANNLIAPTLEKQIANDLQINTLTQLRDALLPKLMSGSIRVTNG